MKINHDTENCRFVYEIQGHIAYLKYELIGNSADVVATFVPKPLEGRGIASRLMQAFYDYAQHQSINPTASCSYAEVWLQRHTS